MSQILTVPVASSSVSPGDRIRACWRLLLLSSLLLGVLLQTTAGAQDSPIAERCPVADLPKRTLPDIGAAPVRVSLGVFLIDIMGIHDNDETFDTDIALRLRWRDSRLSFDALGTSLEDCDVDLRDIWHPQ